MSNTRKSDTINFRTTKTEKDIIQKAAKAKKVSESEYARSSAIKQAEMDLADRTHFSVSPDELAAFATAIDRPVQKKQNLRKLLQEPSVLE